MTPDPAGTPAQVPDGSQAFPGVAAQAFVNGPVLNVKGYKQLTVLAISTNGLATAAADAGAGANIVGQDGIVTGQGIPAVRNSTSLNAGNASKLVQYDLYGINQLRPWSQNANAAAVLDITLEWWLS